MTVTELIKALQRVGSQHIGGVGHMPVVMCTQSGSGEVNNVTVMYDPVLQRCEVQLQEKP